MTRWQRIKSILSGLGMIFFAVFLVAFPEYALPFIALVIGLSATVRGIGKLGYYFSMARFMIGGKSILYQGIIMLDFGLFTVGFADIPAKYIMVYLLIGYLFYGLIDIMRAREIRRNSNGRWQGKFMLGVVNFALGIICICRVNSDITVIYIYSLGMIISALDRISSAFRRSAVIYVQQA